MLCIAITFKYQVHLVYLIKMKVMTFTSYKVNYELYTEIHNLIAANSCQIELARKDIVLLSNKAVLFYKAGLQTGVEDSKYVKYILSAGVCSIDGFNAKVKVAVLQERADWKMAQIKDLKTVIPEHYTFMTSFTIFIVLVIPENYP